MHIKRALALLGAYYCVQEPDDTIDAPILTLLASFLLVYPAGECLTKPSLTGTHWAPVWIHLLKVTLSTLMIIGLQVNESTSCKPESPQGQEPCLTGHRAQIQAEQALNSF